MVFYIKDIIYNENSKGKVQVAVEEDSIPKINSDDDDDAISTLAPTMSPNSQPSSRQCSLTHRYSSLRHYSSPPQQIEQDQALIISPYRDQLKQKQKQSINEGDSSSLGSFRDKIIMQSTPVHQSQLVHGLKSSKKNTSEKKRTEDVDSLFGSDQEVEERRAALFDRVKELQPIPDSPPRQPFFNLRK
jgi:hypothetical protein